MLNIIANTILGRLGGGGSDDPLLNLPTTDLLAAWSTVNPTWIGAGNDELASFYGDDATREPRPKTAINFPTASTSHLRFTNMEKFALSKAWSVAMWLKPINSTGTEYVLSSARSNTLSGFIISKNNTSVQVILQNNLTTDFKTATIGNALSGTLSTAFLAGVWNHLIITYDGSGTANGVNFHFNGFLCAKSATGGQLASGSEFAVAPDYFYTCQTAAGFANYEGALADLRFYNGALTEAEALQVYRGDLLESKLLVKLNCEEGAGTTLYNSYKTAGNITTYTQAYGDATLHNSPTWVADNIESYANLYGYTLSGSTYIPVNIAQPTTNALGNAAQYTGKVKHRIRVTDKVNMTGINFNPFNAPLSWLSYFTHTGANQHVRFTQTDVPANYAKGDYTFAFSDVSNPYFKQIKGANETKFLIYRKKKFGEDLNDVLNYIDYSTPVILVLGQSNADGSGTLFSDLGAEYQVSFNNVMCLYNIWTEFSNPGLTNKPGNQFGPELEQMRQLNNRGDKIYYFLKNATGGTSLANDPNFVDWWPDHVGEKWTDLVNAIDLFKTLIGNRKFHFAYLNWDQGENDLGLGKDTAYATNLTYFMLKLRELTETPNLKIVLRRMRETLSGYDTTVTRAKELEYCTVIDPARADYYDYDDCPLQADLIHLTSLAQIESGNRGITKAISREWI